MKTFIYTLEFKKSSYGSNVINTVYRIKNNKPVLVGEKRYNTGSYKGHDHEALNLIVSEKQLPKTALKGGYINFEKLGKEFELIEL